MWFANQLSDDACASLALLNIALNCPDLAIGEELTAFRNETEGMSPVVGGRFWGLYDAAMRWTDDEVWT